MAIDPTTETLLSLAEAAARLPRRRAGRKVSLSCVYRWTTIGCRKVVLESVQIGGTRCTSLEALSRFFDRLTYGENPSCSYRTAAKREDAAQRAVRELEQRGA